MSGSSLKPFPDLDFRRKYYGSFGLKIAGISSVKFDAGMEGSLKNNYQYQGDYSEMDDDIGWNDFALRNYDAQVGRWVQQDQFQQFPSPYIGMGNDPINLIDPSGGWAATGLFEGMSRASIMATTTLGGAIVGMGVDLLSGGNGGKGLLIGATLGLGSNFSLGNFVSASLNVGGEVLSNAVSNSVISQSTNSYAKWAGYNGNSFPSFKTLLSNYPLPYEIRPDRTPSDPRYQVNDQNGNSFLYYNQCSIRMSLTLRRSGVNLAGAKNITNPGHSPYGNGNILGATNLAGFLIEKFAKPEIYNGTKTDIASKLNGRTGIIYFQGYNENYGSNAPPLRSSANVHIDLWNKNRIMAPYLNQMLDSTTVFFWEVK